MRKEKEKKKFRIGKMNKKEIINERG